MHQSWLAFFLIALCQIQVSLGITSINLASQYPQFTTQNPSGGFFASTQNAVVLAETTTGDIASISLTSPLGSATPYYSYTLAYMSSLDFLSQSSSQGGECRYDNVYGISLRPQGNSWFSSLGFMDWNTFVNLDSDNLQVIDNYNQNGILQTTFNSASWSSGYVISVWNTYPQAAVPWNYVKIFIYASTSSSSISMYYVCYTLQSRKTILGTGWNNPVDIKPNGDSSIWWIAESTGVYQVSASTPNKASASLLIPATLPSSLAYDSNSHLLYCVENAANGKIWVWNGMSASVLYSGVQNGAGIVGDSLTAKFQSLYISEKGSNSVFQLNLQNLLKTSQLTGFNIPQQISPNPQNPQQFYVVDSSAVYLTDWTLPTAPTLTSLLSLNGAKTALSLTNALLAVYGGQFFDLVTLPSYLSSSSLTFLGIGFVPISNINSNGYATVTGAGYPINCVDAPFGGSITVIVNHPGARQQGATHYAIWLAGTWIGSSFGDYKLSWNPQTQTNQFMYTLTTPTAFDNSGRWFYPLRSPSDLWMNPYWGGVIDTLLASNGLNWLYVEFYNINQGSSPVGINWITYGSTPIMIDNVYPQVSINQIYYVVNNQLLPVSACAIVTGSSHLFEFNISVSDPEVNFRRNVPLSPLHTCRKSSLKRL